MKVRRVYEDVGLRREFLQDGTLHTAKDEGIY